MPSFYENIDSYRDLKQKIEEENDILDIEEVEETPIEQNNNNNNNEEKKEEQEKRKDNDNNNDNENNNNKKEEEEEKIQDNKIKLKSSKNIKSSLLINNDNDKKVNSSPLEKVNDNNPFQKIEKKNTTIGSKSSLLRRSSRISQKESFVYIPKVICLISIHPYIKTFEKILKSIYELYIDVDTNTIEKDNKKIDKKEIPLEKYITNLIIEVPIPPRGLYSISYELLDIHYMFKGYENNKLFVTENNLYKFNSLISLKVKLEIFKHLLFGSKVIFFSTKLNLISETMLAFLTLLYPFNFSLQAMSNLFKDD